MAQERAYSTGEINDAVRKHLSPRKPVKIGGLDGHDGVLAGLHGEGRVTVSGNAGSFLAAFLAGPWVTLSGSAGDFAGSTLVSGRLVVEGTVGRGMCCHMVGGEARVKGRVGADAGAMMSGGMLVLDAPVGPGPGEGMTGGTLVLLRPNHLPRRLPPPPAMLVVPRGTSRGVRGVDELEMDHQEVEELAARLEDLGVSSPAKVAELLVVLVPEDERPLPAAEPAKPRATPSEGVVLEVAPEVDEGEGTDREGADGEGGGGEEKGTGPDRDTASKRFASFRKELKGREGG